MRIINKFFKKNILLTLMFTNYGMDAPDNTQNINTENLLALQDNKQNINTENSNKQNINTESSLEVSPLQKEINSMKKQEFNIFLITIEKIVDRIKEIFRWIIIIYSLRLKQYLNLEKSFNEIIENHSFSCKNILSFIEQAKNNYNPDYKLDILYQELTVEKNNIHEIFTPFLYDIDKYKDKEKPINFISNMITNCNELLRLFYDYYDLPNDFNAFNKEINGYISIMEEYLFFITMEKYLFFKKSDPFIVSFLFNLNKLYENSNLKFKDDSELQEEEKLVLKLVLKQFTQLIILRNETNNTKKIKQIKAIPPRKSEIPSIIEDYNNNKSKLPCIQRLIHMKKEEELEKKKQEELEKKKQSKKKKNDIIIGSQSIEESTESKKI